MCKGRQTGKNGENYYKVSDPKFKLGEESVRGVASEATYPRYLYFTLY